MIFGVHLELFSFQSLVLAHRKRHQNAKVFLAIKIMKPLFNSRIEGGLRFQYWQVVMCFSMTYIRYGWKIAHEFVLAHIPVKGRKQSKVTKIEMKYSGRIFRIARGINSRTALRVQI